MKKIKLNLTRIRQLACAAASALAVLGSAQAAGILKLDNTNVLTDPLSWNGGMAPGGSDIALWDGSYAATNNNGSTYYYLGASTNWGGIQLLSPSRQVTIADDGSTLTLGTSGLDLSSASQNLFLSPPLAMAAPQTWAVTNGRILYINNNVSSGGNVLSITGYGNAANHGIGLVTFGNGGATGSEDGPIALIGGANLRFNITNNSFFGPLSGSATNSLVEAYGNGLGTITTLTFADGVNTFGAIHNYTATNTLLLVASGNCTNIFPGPSGLTAEAVFDNYNGGTLIFNGGTYIVPGTIGYNNGGQRTWGGINYLTNATLIAGDARFIHGVTYLQNGGVFALTNASGSRISFDSQVANVNEGFYVQPGGTLDAWGTQYGFNLNGGGSGSTTFVEQTGGQVLVGVNGNPTKNLNLLLGSSGAASTCYYDLSGGLLKVAGTIQQNGTTASANSFNWTGGTLAAKAINMTAISGGFLTNAGGVFAPGDTGTPGKTVLTGNYVQTSGSLAIDIGGATQANAFTNVASDYDFVSVSGTIALGGNLSINLINGFTPAATDAFTVMTGSSITAGPENFANNYNGYVPVAGHPGVYMQAITVGNNLVLTNYGVTPPALTADFTPTNAIGAAPFQVNFTDLSSGAITNRHWDFGDSSTLDTTLTAVSHTYGSVGNYTVTLTVYAADGSTSTLTGVVHATPPAQNLTWQGDGVNNAWDTSTANWLNGGVGSTYADPDNVTFDDTGSVTPDVQLNFVVQPTSVTFNNSAKSYTITGSGGIDSSASLTVGSGNVTLLTANTYTGPTTINGGTLQIGNGTTSGSIDNSSAINNYGALVLNQPDNHTVAGTISGYGTLTKSGAGSLTLPADNSGFSGAITANGGNIIAATDNSLGSGALTLNNAGATWQTISDFTTYRSLTLDGTNDALNVNSTVTLGSALSGNAAVTIGGNGTVQVDSGGNSVSFPTNVNLNGGSIAYNRYDTYSQPGVISGNSVSSSINNLSTSTGNTNTLTFADGINVFGNILNSAPAEMDLTGSPNSTNILGGTTGLGYTDNTYGVIVINGGSFVMTNAPLYGSILGGHYGGNLIINGGTLDEAYANGANGGARFMRGNLTVNGGTFHVGSGGLGLCVQDGQTFNLNGGQVILDNSAGGNFYGLRLGSYNGAALGGSYAASVTGIQSAGLLSVSNSAVDIGSTNSGKVATYSLTGGTMKIIGGGADLNLGASLDGTGSSVFTLTNASLTVLGTIRGKQPAPAVQVFSFQGGSLAAGTIDMSNLRDDAANPPGTLVNGNGALIPGDVGYAGKLTVNGNYVSSNAAALDIEVGWFFAANAAQEVVNTNRYDNVLVNGSATLAGTLNLSLINGYEPIVAANRTFTILTATNGVSGTFANINGGRVSLVGDPTRSFLVTITSTNVVLSNYQTPSVQAYFTQDLSGGTAPVTVTFTNLSNGAGLTNLWTFGDGGTSTSTAATVSHTYPAAGTYDVSLTAGNGATVNSYTVTGAVTVTAPAAPPSIGGISVAGGSVLLTGTGGTPGASYRVLTSTNVATPVALWLPVATNTFAGDGGFTNSIPVTTGVPQSFYRVVTP